MSSQECDQRARNVAPRLRRRRRWQGAAVAALLASGAFAAPAAAGPTWTQVPPGQLPGLTSTITAIEYQSESRLWFGTADGEVWRRRADLSGFERVWDRRMGAVRDIEFQSPGNVGFAVGDSGLVLRSADAGATWTDVNAGGAIEVSGADARGGADRCTTRDRLNTVFFVRFTAPNRVYVGSTGRRLARSQTTHAVNVGSPGTWQDANAITSGSARPTTGNNCKIEQGGGFVDLAATGNPNVFYLFVPHNVLKTTDNLAGTPLTKGHSPASGFDVGGRTAIDPADPSRIWGVMDGRRAEYTENGFDTDGHWFRERGFTWPSTGAMDVDFAGSTVLAAGKAGLIINSIDGREFYSASAGGELETREWRAVALADASRGAVGGTGGKLILTSEANRLADLIAPTGTIAGPATIEAGRAATFTAEVTDSGDGIDPDGFAWSATGLPGQTGQTVTYTFATAGLYTLRVTFKDRAGNTATATKSLTVTRPSTTTTTTTPTPPPSTLPAFTFPAARRPPATAIRRGRYVAVRIRGSFKVPAGVERARACVGRVFFTVFRGKRQLRHAKGRLSRGCGFAKTLRVSRRQAGAAKRLKVRVRFFGNTVLRAAQKDYAVRIRRR